MNIQVSEFNTNGVFKAVKMAIVALETTNKHVVGIKIYLPLWVDILMDFESIKNPILHSTNNGMRTMFGHPVFPGYEDEIIVCNTGTYPAQIIKIKR